MNHLIVIENGQLDAVCLDDRTNWELGRGDAAFQPDIRLHALTVSRRHGRFQNVDGCWCYIDYYGKNGTCCNGKRLHRGVGGRPRPMMLKDGDVFIFGSGDEATINGKTVWAVYLELDCDQRWRAADTRGKDQLEFYDGNQLVRLGKPEKGTVVRQNDGAAIYMGDITYLFGKTQLRLDEE